MFIDTHCHLDDPKLLPNVEEVVNKFKRERIDSVITMGCEVKTSHICKDLAEKFDEVYFGAGIHPTDVKDASERDIEEIKKLADHPFCVCIGEIGLDLYWDKTYREKQIEYFSMLIDTAYEKKLPMSIHMRSATLDTMNVLKENKNKLVYGGVLHCYAGSKETLKEVLDLGLYVGFGGTVTFKNANNILTVAPLVPSDRILTETDCPFLAPEPVRGTVNTPANIPFIAAKLASLRGTDVEEFAGQVTDNAKRLFTKLKPKSQV